MRRLLWFGLAGIMGLLLISQISLAVPNGHPIVRVMPDGVDTPTKHTVYAWAGNALDVWGNVTWGSSNSGDYEWDFGDGSSHDTGPIGDPRNISISHTYAAAGTYYAILTVTADDNLTGTAQVRIDVLPAANTQAQINLAIERGLKFLYLNQDVNGNSDPSWGYWPKGGWSPGYSKTDGAAQTALSVLAFENRGHLPINPDTDIYRNTVIDGLNFALWTINDYRTDFSDNWQNPDINGLGAIIGYLGYTDESFYPHGMVMMALAAAGPYDKNYPVNDAVHNPALNLTVPDWVADSGWWYAGTIPINGWTYYKVMQSTMEYAAWAQADPYVWNAPPNDDYTQRGGWRYQANSYDSDNSVGQWPVIGLEAAEQWGIVAPAWVKSELETYWLHHSYNTSYHGWGYGGLGYGGGDYVDAAHAGAGLSMMAYVGIPKTDAWYQEALGGLANHWANQYYYTWEGYYWDWWPSHFGPTDAGIVYNYYAMYGIAKAMRIARDSSGKTSEVTQIGTHNWYDEYSQFLLGSQQGNGSWPGFWYWGTDTAAPFSILILEPTVSSLRPVAAISASPNPVNALTTVNFDIRGSTHQDPAKYLASWKLIFDASGVVNWSSPDAHGNFPAPVTIPKTGGYPQTGIDHDVTAIVQVTDNVGETAEATVVVHIISGLVSPVANPGGPYFGAVGVSIILNGSGSYTPNAGGTPLHYEWDLDGNGIYETNAGYIPTLPHTWNTPYVGLIGLRVTDQYGKFSTTSVYTKITVCDLKPVSYPLISYRRISATVWEYTYKFVIKNQGNGDATAVSAMLQNWPSQVAVVDGNVSFPDVLAGGQVTSTDTFTIRINRSVPVQNSDLTWKLTFTDAAHTTWVLVNFPLY